MKKGLSIILLPTLLFSLCACKEESNKKYVVKETLTETYEIIKDKVVYIKSSTGDDFEVGSGVAIKEDENYVYFLTNKHVVSTVASSYVDNFENVEVRFKDGKVEEASIVGTFKDIDVAVIKIEKEKVKGSYTIADVDGEYRLGETVVVYGNPMTIPFVMSSGIVSNLFSEVDFTVNGLGKYYGIQTDASINPGNSGGGLFDVDGKLLGIVQGGMEDRNGIGYAVPSECAYNVALNLIETGSYTVNEFDFSYDLLKNVDVETSLTSGIYVKTGTYAGKVIKSINNRKVETLEEMYMIRYTSDEAFEIEYVNLDGTDVLA